MEIEKEVLEERGTLTPRSLGTYVTYDRSLDFSILRY